MTETVCISVNDSSLISLPDGEYTITIGEYYSELYKEIAGPTTKNFFFYNNYITFPTYLETSISVIGVLVSVVILSSIALLLRKLKKGRK
jgi:hypothetical protein